MKEKGYSTTLLGNEAVKLIGEHDPAKPLYLYLAFNAAHTPYQATKEYLELYQQIAEPNRRAYAGSITAMDDQISRVLAALDRKKMRDTTLIVFHSDNGGTRNALFAGEGDMSKIKLPCDNGPYREGKGSLYEGATRVCALANWPGHIRAGSTVDGMIHAVDWYPTRVALAGAQTTQAKPPDGMNVWPAISEGEPSPRTEIVYNTEPFRAAIRQGDWKLVWQTLLPEVVELYNLTQDPSERHNVAAQNPDKVAALQQRANELAATMAKPMILQTEIKAMMQRIKLPPSLPAELGSLN